MVAAATTLLAGGVSAQSIRIDRENVRFTRYLSDLAGPGAFVGVLGAGVLDQLRHGNDGIGGLAGGIGAHAAQSVVQTSVRHGLAALMHRSTDYPRCQCSGFGRKVGHALRETFTDRGADGSRALSVPRLAGAYAGGVTRLAWERDQSPGAVVAGTTLSLGFSALFNIARELTGVGR